MSTATDRPCDCPAYDPELGWHTAADHEQDCGWSRTVGRPCHTQTHGCGRCDVAGGV